MRLPEVAWFLGSFADLEPRALVAAATAAEAAGIEQLWFGEHGRREAVSLASMLLHRTERLAVGPAVASIWSRTPQATAAAARLLCEHLPGRFLLGLGTGHASPGPGSPSPVAAMRHYLTELEVSWRDDLGSPRPVPVLLAALGPSMGSLALTAGDGAISFMATADHTQRLRDHSADGQIVAIVSATPARTRAAARDAAGPLVRACTGLPNYRRHLLRLGFDEDELVDPVSDRLFDALVAWGGPAGIAERIDEHRAAGAQQVALNVHVERPQEAIRLIAAVQAKRSTTTAR